MSDQEKITAATTDWIGWVTGDKEAINFGNICGRICLFGLTGKVTTNYSNEKSTHVNLWPPVESEGGDTI